MGSYIYWHLENDNSFKELEQTSISCYELLHNCDTKSLDNININYRQRRQGRRRRRSRCDDQLSVSSFASAESTGTDVIVRTPLPKHTDFSTLLARWHDVAQRLGREREMEMDKQTSWSMPRPGSRCRSQIRRLGLGSGLKLELEGDGSGRQSQLKNLNFEFTPPTFDFSNAGDAPRRTPETLGPPGYHARDYCSLNTPPPPYTGTCNERFEHARAYNPVDERIFHPRPYNLGLFRQKQKKHYDFNTQPGTELGFSLFDEDGDLAIHGINERIDFDKIFGVMERGPKKKRGGAKSGGAGRANGTSTTGGKSKAKGDAGTSGSAGAGAGGAGGTGGGRRGDDGGGDRWDNDIKLETDEEEMEKNKKEEQEAEQRSKEEEEALEAERQRIEAEQDAECRWRDEQEKVELERKRTQWEKEQAAEAVARRLEEERQKMVAEEKAADRARIEQEQEGYRRIEEEKKKHEKIEAEAKARAAETASARTFEGIQANQKQQQPSQPQPMKKTGGFWSTGTRLFSVLTGTTSPPPDPPKPTTIFDGYGARPPTTSEAIKKSTSIPPPPALKLISATQQKEPALQPPSIPLIPVEAPVSESVPLLVQATTVTASTEVFENATPVPARASSKVPSKPPPSRAAVSKGQPLPNTARVSTTAPAPEGPKEEVKATRKKNEKVPSKLSAQVSEMPKETPIVAKSTISSLNALSKASTPPLELLKEETKPVVKLLKTPSKTSTPVSEAPKTEPKNPTDKSMKIPPKTSTPVPEGLKKESEVLGGTAAKAPSQTSTHVPEPRKEQTPIDSNLLNKSTAKAPLKTSTLVPEPLKEETSPEAQVTTCTTKSKSSTPVTDPLTEGTLAAPKAPVIPTSKTQPKRSTPVTELLKEGTPTALKVPATTTIKAQSRKSTPATELPEVEISATPKVPVTTTSKAQPKRSTPVTELLKEGTPTAPKVPATTTSKAQSRKSTPATELPEVEISATPKAPVTTTTKAQPKRSAPTTELLKQGTLAAPRVLAATTSKAQSRKSTPVTELPEVEISAAPKAPVTATSKAQSRRSTPITEQLKAEILAVPKVPVTTTYTAKSTSSTPVTELLNEETSAAQKVPFTTTSKAQSKRSTPVTEMLKEGALAAPKVTVRGASKAPSNHLMPVVQTQNGAVIATAKSVKPPSKNSSPIHEAPKECTSATKATVTTVKASTSFSVSQTPKGTTATTMPKVKATAKAPSKSRTPITETPITLQQIDTTSAKTPSGPLPELSMEDIPVAVRSTNKFQKAPSPASTPVPGAQTKEFSTATKSMIRSSSNIPSKTTTPIPGAPKHKTPAAGPKPTSKENENQKEEIIEPVVTTAAEIKEVKLAKPSTLTPTAISTTRDPAGESLFTASSTGTPNPRVDSKDVKVKEKGKEMNNQSMIRRKKILSPAPSSSISEDRRAVSKMVRRASPVPPVPLVPELVPLTQETGHVTHVTPQTSPAVTLETMSTKGTRTIEPKSASAVPEASSTATAKSGAALLKSAAAALKPVSRTSTPIGPKPATPKSAATALRPVPRISTPVEPISTVAPQAVTIMPQLSQMVVPSTLPEAHKVKRLVAVQEVPTVHQIPQYEVHKPSPLPKTVAEAPPQPTGAQEATPELEIVSVVEEPQSPTPLAGEGEVKSLRTKLDPKTLSKTTVQKLKQGQGEDKRLKKMTKLGKRPVEVLQAEVEESGVEPAVPPKAPSPPSASSRNEGGSGIITSAPVRKPKERLDELPPLDTTLPISLEAPPRLAIESPLKAEHEEMKEQAECAEVGGEDINTTVSLKKEETVLASPKVKALEHSNTVLFKKDGTYPITKKAKAPTSLAPPHPSLCEVKARLRPIQPVSPSPPNSALPDALVKVSKLKCSSTKTPPPQPSPYIQPAALRIGYGKVSDIVEPSVDSSEPEVSVEGPKVEGAKTRGGRLSLIPQVTKINMNGGKGIKDVTGPFNGIMKSKNDPGKIVKESLIVYPSELLAEITSPPEVVEVQPEKVSEVSDIDEQIPELTPDELDDLEPFAFEQHEEDDISKPVLEMENRALEPDLDVFRFAMDEDNINTYDQPAADDDISPIIGQVNEIQGPSQGILPIGNPIDGEDLSKGKKKKRPSVVEADSNGSPVRVGGIRSIFRMGKDTKVREKEKFKENKEKKKGEMLKVKEKEKRRVEVTKAINIPKTPQKFPMGSSKDVPPSPFPNVMTYLVPDTPVLELMSPTPVIPTAIQLPKPEKEQKLQEEKMGDNVKGQDWLALAKPKPGQPPAEEQVVEATVVALTEPEVEAGVQDPEELVVEEHLTKPTLFVRTLADELADGIEPGDMDCDYQGSLQSSPIQNPKGPVITATGWGRIFGWGLSPSSPPLRPNITRDIDQEIAEDEEEMSPELEKEQKLDIVQGVSEIEEPIPEVVLEMQSVSAIPEVREELMKEKQMKQRIKELEAERDLGLETIGAETTPGAYSKENVLVEAVTIELEAVPVMGAPPKVIEAALGPILVEGRKPNRKAKKERIKKSQVANTHEKPTLAESRPTQEPVVMEVSLEPISGSEVGAALDLFPVPDVLLASENVITKEEQTQEEAAFESQSHTEHPNENLEDAKFADAVAEVVGDEATAMVEVIPLAGGTFVLPTTLLSEATAKTTTETTLECTQGSRRKSRHLSEDGGRGLGHSLSRQAQVDRRYRSTSIPPATTPFNFFSAATTVTAVKKLNRSSSTPRKRKDSEQSKGVAVREEKERRRALKKEEEKERIRQLERVEKERIRREEKEEARQQRERKKEEERQKKAAIEEKDRIRQLEKFLREKEKEKEKERIRQQEKIARRKEKESEQKKKKEKAVREEEEEKKRVRQQEKVARRKEKEKERIQKQEKAAREEEKEKERIRLQEKAAREKEEKEQIRLQEKTVREKEKQWQKEKELRQMQNMVQHGSQGRPDASGEHRRRKSRASKVDALRIGELHEREQRPARQAVEIIREDEGKRVDELVLRAQLVVEEHAEQLRLEKEKKAARRARKVAKQREAEIMAQCIGESQEAARLEWEAIRKAETQVLDATRVEQEKELERGRRKQERQGSHGYRHHETPEEKTARRMSRRESKQSSRRSSGVPISPLTLGPTIIVPHASIIGKKVESEEMFRRERKRQRQERKLNPEAATQVLPPVSSKSGNTTSESAVQVLVAPATPDAMTPHLPPSEALLNVHHREARRKAHKHEKYKDPAEINVIRTGTSHVEKGKEKVKERERKHSTGHKETVGEKAARRAARKAEKEAKHGKEISEEKAARRIEKKAEKSKRVNIAESKAKEGFGTQTMGDLPLESNSIITPGSRVVPPPSPLATASAGFGKWGWRLF